MNWGDRCSRASSGYSPVTRSIMTSFHSHLGVGRSGEGHRCLGPRAGIEPSHTANSRTSRPPGSGGAGGKGVPWGCRTGQAFLTDYLYIPLMGPSGHPLTNVLWQTLLSGLTTLPCG